MTRKRLRPAYSDAELKALYRTPHDHRRWRDHRLRVDVTVAVARWMAGDGVDAAADLSCGNGAILSAVPAGAKYFGDIAPGYRFQGPIEDTIMQIPQVDLFVCSETLEHVDAPMLVLGRIRDRARMLVLSTPVDAWDDDNPEHYWAWSREDIEEMLAAAGWTLHVYATADFRPQGLPYCFGIWGVR
ncbi:hypothetical protein C1I98_06155 [Spongiactinospora gelatinilytica]|uniref:Methyltransferase domain-containing protein n=1 Tax=Spongiactinospora gelatinilytica TaxID=2666298 RepID=A0A2W2I4R2_9ACTN|nr:hypothetical protein [Spongiactinospora gelatinilytica]PZG53137.1 hypothetical protein C1I98_06155 [Spongiactinospora gelatinilytica]